MVFMKIPVAKILIDFKSLLEKMAAFLHLL